MSLEYTVADLDPTHYTALSELHEKVFGKPFPVNQIAAKYTNTLLQKPAFAKLAFAPDSTLVASWGVLPVEFVLNGKTIWAGQAADVMTHPEHRRQKLFHNLGLLAAQKAREIGFGFMFAFPNPEIRPALKRALGWETVQRFEAYEYTAADKPWTGVFGQKEKTGTWFPEELIFLGGMKENLLYSRHTQSLFHHKRMVNDSRIIQFEHGWAWFQLDRNMQIGDLAPSSMEEGNLLVEEILEFGKKRGVFKFYFQSTPFPEAKHWFHNGWKHLKTWQILAHPLQEGIPLERLFLTLADLDSF